MPTHSNMPANIPDFGLPPEPAAASKPDRGSHVSRETREKLERASSSVQKGDRSKQQFEDGRQLPAFKKLMQKTQQAYTQGQWNEAEAAALQAQRLAPQSAETFLYLALVAQKKNKPANAEALAQRGLSYAQSNAMKKQLWYIILRASEARNHSIKAQQAKRMIQSL